MLADLDQSIDQLNDWKWLILRANLGWTTAVKRAAKVHDNSGITHSIRRIPSSFVDNRSDEITVFWDLRMV
jgi:hypothetical protein